MNKRSIRVVIPYHLQTLAKAGPEIAIELAPPFTGSSLLDAIESRYPTLRGNHSRSSHQATPTTSSVFRCSATFRTNHPHCLCRKPSLTATSPSSFGEPSPEVDAFQAGLFAAFFAFKDLRHRLAIVWEGLSKATSYKLFQIVPVEKLPSRKAMLVGVKPVIAYSQREPHRNGDVKPTWPRFSAPQEAGKSRF